MRTHSTHGTRMQVIAAAVALLTTAHTAEADALLLVDAGEARALIVVPDGASSQIREAAEELRDHVDRASGAPLRIAPEGEAGEVGDELPARVYLGATEAAQEAGLDAGSLAADAYALRSDDAALYIVGGNDRGVRYGVYELLERELGVRWLWPGELGTYVPSAQTIAVQRLDEHAEPALKWRRIRWRRVRYPYMYDRDAFNVERNIGLGYSSMDALLDYAGELHQYRQRHRQGFTESRPDLNHLADWWQEHGQDNPEWFWMNEDGERGASEPDARHVALCVSNPDLHRHFVENYWDGETPSFALGGVDRRNFCQCQDCLAWDGPQPDDPPWFAANLYEPQVVSDRYARFWKAVQQKAADRDPDVTVGTFLYWNYMPAPQEFTDLNENIYGDFVPWAAPLVTFYPMPEEADAWVREQWLGWKATGIRMGYRPNYLHDGYAMPLVDTWQSGEFFRFAYEHGMEGADFDSLTGQWAAHGPKLYMHFRLIAKPELSVEQIREEYFSAFGPAAEAVEQYFDYWEDHSYAIKEDLVEIFRDIGGRWSRFPLGAHEAYPPEVFEPAASILDDALVAAESHEDPQYAERVEFLKLGLEHARLCAQLAAAFDGDQQIATDDPERVRDARRVFDELRAFRHEHEHTYFADLDAMSLRERIWFGVESLLVDEDDLGLLPGPWERWAFRTDPKGKGLERGWHTAEPDTSDWIKLPVPARWSETNVGGDYYGYGWYRTHFEVPEALADRDLRLHFDGVDEQGWVWVNGEAVGEQSTESTGQSPGALWDQPFTVDVPAKLINTGDKPNLLVVRVHASGGQAGIYQPVWVSAP